MLNRSQKTRLGFFVLASFSLLATAVTVLAGRVMFTSSDSFKVHFAESVSGLEEGAPVKLNGVRVGRVESIRILPDDVSKVEVKIDLLPTTPVKQSTRAVINTAGLTGLRYVELVGGTRESPPLQAPGVIEADMSFMGRMTDKADDITDDMHVLLRQVVQLTSPENQDKITSIMDSFRQFADNSNLLVQTSQTNLQKGVALIEKNTAGIAQVTERLNLMLEENREALRKTTDATRTLLGPEGAQKTMEEMRKTLTSSRELVETLNRGLTGNMKDVAVVLQNMNRTLVNLEEFTRTIKDQPSALIGGRRNGKN